MEGARDRLNNVTWFSKQCTADMYMHIVNVAMGATKRREVSEAPSNDHHKTRYQEYTYSKLLGVRGREYNTGYAGRVNVERGASLRDPWGDLGHGDLISFKLKH